MPNKKLPPMRSLVRMTLCEWLVLSALLLGGYPAQALADQPPDRQTDTAAGAAAASTEQPRNSAEATDDSGAMPAPPADARPSLDYEPSETISEDKSVSFPIDI